MRKMFVVSSITATMLIMGGVTASADTNVPQQHLQPGQAGYVGALNDRPSNAYTPSTSANKRTGIQPSNLGYWYQSEPADISVLMLPNNDPNAPISEGTVVSYNFDYYLENVLPNEWEGSWPTQALEAGAVSVRSYAWYCTNNPKYAAEGAALDNTTNSQVFKPGTSYPATDSAISATAGEAVAYGDSEEGGYYKAGNYDSYRDSSSYNFKNNAYQNGEDYWANQGESYTWMLSYYYPGTRLVTGGGY